MSAHRCEALSRFVSLHPRRVEYEVDLESRLVVQTGDFFKDTLQNSETRRVPQH